MKYLEKYVNGNHTVSAVKAQTELVRKWMLRNGGRRLGTGRSGGKSQKKRNYTATYN